MPEQVHRGRPETPASKTPIVQNDSAGERPLHGGAEHQTTSLQLEVPVAGYGPQLTLALQPFHREAGDHSGAQCHD